MNADDDTDDEDAVDDIVLVLVGGNVMSVTDVVC